MGYSADVSATPDFSINGPSHVTQQTLRSIVYFFTSLSPRDDDGSSVKTVVCGSISDYAYGNPLLQPCYDSTNRSAAFDEMARDLSDAVRNLGKVLGKKALFNNELLIAEFVEHR